MPSRQKQLLFSTSGLLGLCCALTAAVSTGLPLWLRGAVLCRTGAELVNATGAELDQFLGELQYGLFSGHRVKQCGLGGRPSRFSCESLHTHTHTHVAGLCSCLVMILFASEVKLHHLSDRIANFNEVNFVFQTYTEHYDRSFWLFFLVFLLHSLNFLLIRLAGIQFPFQESKEADLSGGAADLMY
uniref:clarin-1 n=1 Tax=Epinephelus lanceolatus TaxID=310571 RepID=UPI0014485656|nr:clarin-1 [Epinephelus lanceolatus]